MLDSGVMATGGRRLLWQSTATHPTDMQLVRFARDDRVQFVALYERYVLRIYNYMYYRLRNHAAAEDATSEVFTKALAAFERYDDRCFAAWLFRIARNVVIDTHRSAVRDEQLRVARQGIGSQTRDLEKIIADHEALDLALKVLTPEQRTVIELPLAGWPLDEVATVIGRSTAATKQLRYRTLQQLRALLVTDDDRREEYHVK